MKFRRLARNIKLLCDLDDMRMDRGALWPISLSVQHFLERRRLNPTDACEPVNGGAACQVWGHASGPGCEVCTEVLKAAHEVHQEQLVGVPADSYVVDEVLELVLSDLVVELHDRSI